MLLVLSVLYISWCCCRCCRCRCSCSCPCPCSCACACACRRRRCRCRRCCCCCCAVAVVVASAVAVAAGVVDDEDDVVGLSLASCFSVRICKTSVAQAHTKGFKVCPIPYLPEPIPTGRRLTLFKSRALWGPP